MIIPLSRRDKRVLRIRAPGPQHGPREVIVGGSAADGNGMVRRARVEQYGRRQSGPA